jgi:hypothetical protein
MGRASNMHMRVGGVETALGKPRYAWKIIFKWAVNNLDIRMWMGCIGSG